MSQDNLNNAIGQIFTGVNYRVSKQLVLFGQVSDKLRELSDQHTDSMDLDNKAMRYIMAPDYFRSEVISAIVASDIYYTSYKMFVDEFRKGKKKRNSELYSESINVSHLVSDLPPLHLFNAIRFLQSSEILEILGLTSKNVSEIFEGCFPSLISARDFICHAHDRKLGRFRTKQVSEGPLSARADSKGILCFDNKGEPFVFEFQLERFGQLFEELILIIEKRCV